MQLYYISSNLQKFMKEFKITNEELLKIANLNMIHIAEDYYTTNVIETNSFKKIFEKQIKEIRSMKNENEKRNY